MVSKLLLTCMDNFKKNLNSFLLFIAVFAYYRLCTVEEYLQQLVAIPSLQDDLIMHLNYLNGMVSKKSCAVRIFYFSKTISTIYF